MGEDETKYAARKNIYYFLFLGNSKVWSMCHHLRHIFKTVKRQKSLILKNEGQAESVDLQHSMANFSNTATGLHTRATNIVDKHSEKDDRQIQIICIADFLRKLFSLDAS